MAFDKEPEVAVPTTGVESGSEKNNEYFEKIRRRFREDPEFVKECLDEWFGAEFFSKEFIDSDSGRSFNIIDVNAVQQRFSEGFRTHGCIIPRFNVVKALQEHLHGQQFLSTEQIENNEHNTRELFYMPESIEEAFDEVAIKNSKFHLLPSDLVQLEHHGEYELRTASDETESVSSLEVEFVARLFHPDYGDAFRDRKGKMYVRDLESDQYVSISTDSLQKIGFNRKLFNRNTATGEVEQSVLQGMQKRLPHVFEEGILEPTDVREFSARKEADPTRGRYRNITSNGRVTIDGVGHHLRRGFEKREGVRVYVVNNRLGAVLDEDGRVESLFNIFHRDDPEVQQSGKSNRIVSGKSVNLTDINYEELVGEKQPGESAADWLGRDEMLRKGMTTLYKDILSLPELEEAGQKFQAYTLKEQRSLANTALWLEHEERKEDFTAFARKFGTNGLRTFVQLEGQENIGFEILSFAERYPEEAREAFDSYSELLDAADDAEEVVRESVDCEKQDCDAAVERVCSTVLGRAQDLLVRAVRTGSVEEAQEQIAAFSKEGTLFSSTSRALFEQGNFSFEQMKDASFEVADGQELSETDTKEMERLYRANYQDEAFQGEFIETLVGKMKEGLDNPFTRWYVLRHKEKPIGFCKFTDRFDDETGELSERHFGAFNVNRQFGNGKLGEAMFVEVIKEESKEGVPIVAECLPEAPITAKYIETGFNAIRSSEFAGERILHIVRTEETVAHPAKAPDVDTLLDEGWHGHRPRKIETDDTFPELDEEMELVRYFSRGGERYGLFTPKKL